MLSGVPQGSILGPLLFLIYINDFPSQLLSNVCMFADDTKLFRVASSFNNNVALQSDLTCISEWCDKWKLNLNESKCTSPLFTLKTSSGPSLTINDSALRLTSTHRDLGIIVSADLSWSQHISKVCSSAYKVLYFIRRNVYSSHSDVIFHLSGQSCCIAASSGVPAALRTLPV